MGSQFIVVKAFRWGAKVSVDRVKTMSTRPKRTIKPVQRYVPVEEVLDDDYSDDSIDEVDAKKRLKGEFDGLDDEEVTISGDPVFLFPLTLKKSRKNSMSQTSTTLKTDLQFLTTMRKKNM